MGIHYKSGGSSHRSITEPELIQISGHVIKSVLL